MPGNVGLPEIALVAVIALIIFGPKRLPELGRSLGHGIKEFRESVTGSHDDNEPPRTIESTPTPVETPTATPTTTAATPTEPPKQETTSGS